MRVYIYEQKYINKKSKRDEKLLKTPAAQQVHTHTHIFSPGIDEKLILCQEHLSANFPHPSPAALPSRPLYVYIYSYILPVTLHFHYKTFLKKQQISSFILYEKKKKENQEDTQEKRERAKQDGIKWNNPLCTFTHATFNTPRALFALFSSCSQHKKEKKKQETGISHAQKNKKITK